jgi:hypothetical protein
LDQDHFNSTQADHYVTKDELRAELERQEKRYKDVYGGEVTTYAAQPDPERKPWRKRPNYLDQAFERELQKMEKELKQSD